MLQFDTRDRKPTVWNIAVLSAAAAAVLAWLMRGERISLPAVSAVLCLYLFLTILFLLIALVRQIQYNPYSYNTIYYSGFSLFLLSMLLSQLQMVSRTGAVQMTDMEGVVIRFSLLLHSARTFMMYSFPFIALFSGGLCLSNISLIRHEGRRFVNLLGILLSFLLMGGELFLLFGSRLAGGTLQQKLLYDLLVNLFAAMYLYFECMLIGTIMANILVVRYEPEKDRDYLIILGCGLQEDGRPTPLLAGRIDRALAFYRVQIRETGKAPVLITSGGQGPGEVISESASMKAYLLEKGVPEAHILEEDRSRNTYENMLFSREIIRADREEGEKKQAEKAKEEKNRTREGKKKPEKTGGREKPAESGGKEKTGKSGGEEKPGKTGRKENPGETGSMEKTAFSTTNYHVFRSGLLARRVKMRAVGMGAGTKWYFWPNAAVREFVGILTEHRLKQALIFGGMILLYSISTVLLYRMSM